MYDRLVRNLQTLKKENLLSSKDYGLGKENLWSLKKGKALTAIQDQFEDPLIPPKAEIHAFKYEHEKACGDVFVTLALTGNLCGWLQHQQLTKEIIPDRTAQLSSTVHIEVEMGTQNKIRPKAEAYRNYHRNTGKKFQVWFLVDTDRLYQSGLIALQDFTDHYSIQTLTEFNLDSTLDTSIERVDEPTANPANNFNTLSQFIPDDLDTESPSE